MADTTKITEALYAMNLLRNHTSVNSHQIELIDEAIAALDATCQEPAPAQVGMVERLVDLLKRSFRSAEDFTDVNYADEFDAIDRLAALASREAQGGPKVGVVMPSFEAFMDEPIDYDILGNPIRRRTGYSDTFAYAVRFGWEEAIKRSAPSPTATEGGSDANQA